MVTAYVTVTASSGDVDRLKPAMAGIDETIERVEVVAGDVDYVVKARADDVSALKDVAAALRELDGIEGTETHIGME
ncbi:Lrp/AsnC ligand binding domain-containing protein [Halobellus rubicundus]|uniref:Lrp/AsnC ligand binding domain-containing protein n=1 Tax=Halobellus rubicundus TaxID=2996466 RepID=A0ABD5MEU4_9EURY